MLRNKANLPPLEEDKSGSPLTKTNPRFKGLGQDRSPKLMNTFDYKSQRHSLKGTVQLEPKQFDGKSPLRKEFGHTKLSI